MNENTTCPDCGTVLPQNAPAGVCPKCLLKVGLDDSPTDAIDAATRVSDSAVPADAATIPPTENDQVASGSAPKIGDKVKYFGDYELLDEIARGGMGVVYKARQVRLNRTVALKMILGGQLASEDDVKRFHTEAEAAAQLDHPGIVPIFEVGEHDGLHFFSMGLVEGDSLAARIVDSPLPPKEAAALVQETSLAIQYAHDKGVIHRDLKPANILIDVEGHPKVTDFGLAKRVQADSNLTATGQILGTPSYMPPEQATGSVDQVGPAADVYALGAVLYATLTGRPPFSADNPVDTLMQVLEREPISPRQFNSTVPRDLETICLKCLRKDPARRYASAQELADDLQRFLDGKPIHARPATRRERVRKWVRRRPAAAALLGVSTVSVAGLLLLGIALFVRARQFAEEADRRETAERERADLLDAQVASARSHVYSSDIALAAVALEKQNTDALQKDLGALRPKPGEKDLRGFEWYYLWKKNNPERLSLPPITVDTKRYRAFDRERYDSNFDSRHDALSNRRRLVFSPDGKLVATRSNVCAVATGKQLMKYEVCAQVFFSPDGRFLSAGDVIVDLAAKKKLNLPLAPRRQPFRDANRNWIYPAKSVPLGFLSKRNSLVVLQTGEKKEGLASGTAPETKATVKSYAATTAKETVHEFQVRKGYRIVASALCERRGLLAVATAKPSNSSIWMEKDEVEVWDLINGGKKFLQFDRLDKKTHWGNGDLRDLLFSPDGSTLAVITREYVVRLCDPATGKERVRLGKHRLRYWAFSADGRTLMALPREGNMLHLWDATTGKPLANRDISSAGYQSGGRQPEAALSPDGKTYATGGGTKVVQLWDTATGELKATFLGHKHPIRDLTFSPDGKTLVTMDVQLRSPTFESNVKFWNAADEKPIGLPVDTSAVTSLDTSPDGSLAVGFANGMIRLYDAGSLKVRSLLHNKSRQVNVLKFSADGKQLAASHAPSPKPYSAQGRRNRNAERNIDVWDVAVGKVVASFPGHLKAFEANIVAAISSMAEPRSNPRHPDTITLWNVNTRERLVQVKDSQEKHFAMARDGRTAVTVAYARRGGAGQFRFKVWNTTDGKERLASPDAFQARGNASSFSKFSPDGKYLAIGDNFLAVLPAGAKKWTYPSAGRLYDMATGKEKAFFSVARQIRGIRAQPMDNWTLAEFSPDSRLLVTIANRADANGSVVAVRAKVALWDVAAGKELATLPNAENLACIYAAFSPDGKTLATLTFGKWRCDHFPDGKWDKEGKIRMERSKSNESGTVGGTGGLTSMHPVYEIHVWDVASRKRRRRFIVSWKGTVTWMAFSGDGRSLYAGASHASSVYGHGVPTVNRLQIWDVKTGTQRGSIGEHGTRFHALAYAADGRLLALTEQRLNVRRPPQYPSDYKVRSWDVSPSHHPLPRKGENQTRELAAAQTFTATKLPVDLDPKSLTVASNTPPKADAWNDSFSFGAHSSTAVSPDGKVKAVRGYKLPLHTTGSDGKSKVVPSPTDIVLVETATGKVLHTLKSYGQWVTRLAFSPDGKTLAVGENSGKIRLWNVAAGRMLLTLPGHKGSVNGLVFHPGGRVLASCNDTEIRLWRAATDEEIARRKP